MRLCVLGSGSRGNALLVEAGGTRVLIDAGFSPRALARRLRAAHVPPESISALVVTHEHDDHAGGVAGNIERHGWRVYATRGTMSACPALYEAEPITPGVSVAIDGFDILAVRVSHDAIEPIAVVITDRATGERTGIAYDLGVATESLRTAFQRLDTLVVEANHDPELLRIGPYPPVVRRRIASSYGHLSNAAAGAFVANVKHRGLRQVILAHLSENCNTPALALAAVRPMCAAPVIAAGQGTVTDPRPLQLDLSL
ncbi:MAG TPA: MBL fold metallo-hydrolase [Gemmatimonadaceae bacterium]|jgi:phosphoribosyl 1,2-cyclic phosphodiesterase|nr:MBL fold metallo-hydrolase [Gemmatimonadaceae bacterium]